MLKNTIPQWLAFTGQSGAGKGTVIKTLKEILTDNKIPFVHISNGDIVRELSTQNTAVAKKLREINGQGLLTPPALMLSLWVPKVLEHAGSDTVIIHEGSPRWPGEAALMIDLVSSKFLRSIKIIEVYAEEEICAKRLAQRTIVDKRPDLSKDGEPGIPDYEKIRTKMNWYSLNRQEIIEAAKEYRCYKRLDNDSEKLDEHQLWKDIELLF